MKRFISRLRHLTVRRVINKAFSVFSGIKIKLAKRTVKPANAGLIKNIDNLLSFIPDSGGSSYYSRAPLTAGIITDEYMYNYYKDALNLINITPENYKEQLPSCSMLIFVSCWKGMQDNVWAGTENLITAGKVLEYARSLGLKTIFQTIEDPSNYERFVDTARSADYIFTSCAEKVEDYKKDTGNDNVFLLEYGINPIIHNPAGIAEKHFQEKVYNSSTVFFAGSWMDRYKERCRDMSMIFDGLLRNKTDLLIADRNSELLGYEFPKQYQPYIIPVIDHIKLQKVHKLFNFSINVNSIKDSRTMCAMRVYELQALGCLMLSNYALSVSSVFPGLFIVNNPDEAGRFVDGYSKEQIYRMQTENCSLVMSRFTVYDRLNFIFETCGIDYKFPERRVLVLCREKTEKTEQAAASQSYRNITLAEESENTDYSSFDYIAYFSDENDYSEDYITALMNAFKYTDAEFVTKDADFDAHEYNFGTGRASLGKSAVKAEFFSEKVLSENTAEGYGFKLDPFLLNEKKIITGGRKELAVIIPAYNNGKYLYGRCFRSLLRSSIFDKMQIYIIDDGSTDGETEKTIRELCRRYDNVTAYFFADGGSGSASRPRNKGLEMAEEPYVTYLDPDNEASGDGYAKLYKAMLAHNTDFVFGSVFRISQTVKELVYHFRDQLISSPGRLLVQNNFLPHSIQACLFKRTFLTENDITNPVGALGQDSLFFQTAMLAADSAYYVNSPVHMYYAERADSEVNTVTADFFRKFLLLETEQVKQYKKYKIYEEYVKNRLDYFIINWYLEKYGNVISEEKEECADIIEKILALYGKKITDYKGYF